MIKKIASGILPRILRFVPKNQKWLYPFYLAGQLDTVEENFVSPALPAAFDGLTIAFASDIHFGPLFSKREADRLMGKLLSFEPDLLLLGGDYGDIQRNAIAFFNYIKPIPEHIKSYAVVGNHDYGRLGADVLQLLPAMKEKNITPLVNEVALITREGQTLAILGADDYLCGRQDFDKLRTQADFNILLTHSPDTLPGALLHKLPFDLALCGHTHGGQIVIGGRSVHSSSRYKDRYRSGWYEERILVSNGVGTSILPMRIGTRPQVHHLTLLKKPEA